MKGLLVAKICHHSGYFHARCVGRYFGTMITRRGDYSNHNIIKIDKDAFANNLQYFKRQLMPHGSKLCIVLKANAYGHGISQLAPVAAANNADYIGIVDNWEAQLIREELNIHDIPIIRLRPALVEEIMHGTQWGIEETIGSLDQMDSILNYLGTNQHSMYNNNNNNNNGLRWPWGKKKKKNQQRSLNIHVDMDTGIGRSGIAPSDFKEMMNKILGYTMNNIGSKHNKGYINVKGVMTHFAAADEDSIDAANATEKSILQFDDTILNDSESIEKLSQLSILTQNGNNNTNHPKENSQEILYHCSNSGHLLSNKMRQHYEKNKCLIDFIEKDRQLKFSTMIRPGTMSYGLEPDHKNPFMSLPNELLPVMSWSTRIVQINKRREGDNVGYGLEYTCPDERLVATLPIGYADGYLRRLGNKSQVLIHGTRCDVIGRISMDIFTVDITQLQNDNVKPGDECVLVGKQGNNEIKMAEIANIVGTCTREMPCLIGNVNEKKMS